MNLEERIAKLKTSLAEKHLGSSLDEREAYVWSEGFKLGADALAEVFLLRGKIEAFKRLETSLANGLWDDWRAALNVYEAQLEALLKQMEEKV
jgi:hypothetical protein